MSVPPVFFVDLVGILSPGGKLQPSSVAALVHLHTLHRGQFVILSPIGDQAVPLSDSGLSVISDALHEDWHAPSPAGENPLAAVDAWLQRNGNPWRYIVIHAHIARDRKMAARRQVFQCSGVFGFEEFDVKIIDGMLELLDRKHEPGHHAKPL